MNVTELDLRSIFEVPEKLQQWANLNPSEELVSFGVISHTLGNSIVIASNTRQPTVSIEAVQGVIGELEDLEIIIGTSKDPKKAGYAYRVAINKLKAPSEP